MGTPKRSRGEGASIKGIGDLRRKPETLLSSKAQKEIHERISRKARKLK